MPCDLYFHQGQPLCLKRWETFVLFQAQNSQAVQHLSGSSPQFIKHENILLKNCLHIILHLPVGKATQFIRSEEFRALQQCGRISHPGCLRFLTPLPWQGDATLSSARASSGHGGGGMQLPGMHSEKKKKQPMENKIGYCKILMVAAASFAVRQYHSHFQLAMRYPSSC